MRRPKTYDEAEYEREQRQREREYLNERNMLGLEPVEPEYQSNAERRQQWWSERLQERQQQFQQERLMFRTRAQWRSAGKMVIAGDSQAVKTVIARNSGKTLYLFSEDQTRERTKEELLRDAGVWQ